MDERDRRRKTIEPPDREAWSKQMDAVRLFDELTSNPYRNLNPDRVVSVPADGGPAPDYLWMELLITSAWRVWLIDHTGTFRLRHELQHPETLGRSDRTMLGRLRALDRRAFERELGRYLSPAQLDALEARRARLVRHFDDLIARRGAGNVLYDLPPRR